MKVIFHAVNDDCVSGIVPALITADNVDLLGQKIDDLPFSFIAPLRTCNNVNCHFTTPKVNNVRFYLLAFYKKQL